MFANFGRACRHAQHLMSAIPLTGNNFLCPTRGADTREWEGSQREMARDSVGGLIVLVKV